MVPSFSPKLIGAIRKHYPILTVEEYMCSNTAAYSDNLDTGPLEAAFAAVRLRYLDDDAALFWPGNNELMRLFNR